MYFDDIFRAVPVMAILRGYDPGESVRLAENAWDIGITAVEVPIQSPDALESFRAVVAAGRDRGRPVGAGTVTTIEQLDATHAAGGAFTVAPGFSTVIVAESRRRDLPHLPGIATPSEIQDALSAGVAWMKAFPASVLGPGWFRAMRGPFPQIRLVATGGIDAGNAAEFLRSGADVISVGSALADPAALSSIARLLNSPGTPHEKDAPDE